MIKVMKDTKIQNVGQKCETTKINFDRFFMFEIKPKVDFL